MIRKILRSAVALLVLVATLQASADKPSVDKPTVKSTNEKIQTFKGEIADSQCSMNVHSLTRSHGEMLKSKSMGGTAHTCTMYCIQYLGGDLVLTVKDDVYRLDNQDKAKDFAGQKVKLAGSLDSKTRTIHIVKIEVVE
jgi:hypothetical protein